MNNPIEEDDRDCTKVVEIWRVWYVVYIWTRGAGSGRIEAWAMATAIVLSVYTKWRWPDRLCDVLGENRRRGLRLEAARKQWVPEESVEEPNASMDEFQ